MEYFIPIISFLVLVIVIILFIIRNLLLKVEKQEDIIGYYVSYFNNLELTIKESEKRLDKIDQKGSFKSDDEIGWFWVELNKIQENISQFKINNPLNDNQENPQEKI